MNSKHLVVIAGPTAVGKTDLAIKLAKRYNTVVLSADSRQFYKDMTIGTAKPNSLQLAEVQHFFIDNKSTHELYGAGHFAKEAMELLEDLYKEHELVIVVGGSGLYIDALLHGVDYFMDVPLKLRERINEGYKEKGIDWLREELRKWDPVYLGTADPNNPQRLVRALEVSIHSGLPYSSFLKKEKAQRDFIAIPLLINLDRELLYKRINLRVDQMMKQGLLEEVKKLVAHQNSNALKTVGYRELFEFLEGKCSLDEAIDKIKQHTRNYAKRQLTWFRNRNEFEEFGPDDLEKITAYIDIIRQNA